MDVFCNGVATVTLYGKELNASISCYTLVRDVALLSLKMWQSFWVFEFMVLVTEFMVVSIEFVATEFMVFEFTVPLFAFWPGLAIGKHHPIVM